MSKKGNSIDTTQRQRQSLAALRKAFGEAGFVITPVARRFRRQKNDFLALPKRNVRELVLVQPNGRGEIEVRPFCGKEIPKSADDVLVAVRKHAGARIVTMGRILYQRRKESPEFVALLPKKGAQHLRKVLGPDYVRVIPELFQSR